MWVGGCVAKTLFQKTLAATEKLSPQIFNLTLIAPVSKQDKILRIQMTISLLRGLHKHIVQRGNHKAGNMMCTANE